VRVEDENGVVVSGAAVEIGVLAQAGKRDKKTGMTDAAGNAVFAGLPTGSAQAYRVNVPFGGATYSSNPFQLPPSRGFEVTIRRLPVSNDERFLLQFLMRVYLELKDGRVQVVEQSQFTNLGKATYVFPKEGVEIVLPEERVAFQTQPTMGDQRIVESERGFRLFGSIPPGRVNLLWAFDLPLAGTEVAFKQAVPFRTYRFSIEADAPPRRQARRGGDAGGHQPRRERQTLLRRAATGLAPGPAGEGALRAALKLARAGARAVDRPRARGGVPGRGPRARVPRAP
jgi:hypothetical protein